MRLRYKFYWDMNRYMHSTYRRGKFGIHNTMGVKGIIPENNVLQHRKHRQMIMVVSTSCNTCCVVSVFLFLPKRT